MSALFSSLIWSALIMLSTMRWKILDRLVSSRSNRAVAVMKHTWFSQIWAQCYKEMRSIWINRKSSNQTQVCSLLSLMNIVTVDIIAQKMRFISTLYKTGPWSHNRFLYVKRTFVKIYDHKFMQFDWHGLLLNSPASLGIWVAQEQVGS